MYLREMGSVELLSREGEIAIAKRIEAGRDTMIRGLCESALTFEAIMVWREELAPGRILLREVIDLEGTYGVNVPGPVAGAVPGEGVPPPRRRRGRPSPPEAKEVDEEKPEPPRRPTLTTTISTTAPARRSAAMEAELRDGVMEILDAIAAEFEAFRKLQEKLVERRLKGGDLKDEDRKAYDATSKRHRHHLKTLKLNNNRIEALVEQLYAINRA
jgi:RNA polymerase primary sigma factor